MNRLMFLCAAVMMAGCGGDGLNVGTSNNPRFVGRWLVDEPNRGGYAGAYYELGDDGTLSVIGIAPDTSSTRTVANFVREQDGQVCWFDNRWSADDDRFLTVAGDCKDGAMRDIVLEFSTERTQNSAGVFPTVSTVGGESGWRPFSDLRFLRCKDAESCSP